MKTQAIHIGNESLENYSKPIKGEIVSIENEIYYKISNYNMMKPFFMSIVSDSDLWMFISSNGALTAGRKNPDNALFPYYTDDRIHDSHDITGSKTIVRVTKKGKTFLWEPFSSRYNGLYRTERNVYKNIAGNQIIFEEVNYNLQLSFQYSWLNCDRFGFIKKSFIKNNDVESAEINIIDGLQSILPFGADRKFQLEYSTLLDGYKKNELVEDIGLALYTLSSIPTDKAEPSEALKTNTVWSAGLDESVILLCSAQLDLFRMGSKVTQEKDVRAERGAFFLQKEFRLLKNENKEWYIVADLNKELSDIVSLSSFLKTDSNCQDVINSEVYKSTERLKLFIAQADGFQLTDDPLTTMRHFSNSLFNVMRGGIFQDNYLVDKYDFQLFVQNSSPAMSQKHDLFFEKLPNVVEFFTLIPMIEALDDPDLEKLGYEYLPLSFSRRHGDPSRPWNYFSIDIKDNHGDKILNYQGNWRDIFQNWEALALSYPGYIENMISKFVNASTADGYNPYRVTRDGFEWEVLDKSDAWSYIGYWGDHQVIYLLKLLELSVHYHPAKLQSLLIKEIYSYANVPYKIKPFREIIRDPKNTIDFDFDKEILIQKRVDKNGEYGKYIWDSNEKIYRVNLAEKLLLMALVRFSNFIPEAGIWMNTQRPEWNDANNALVGFGVSMVTVFHLRRFIVFCNVLFSEIESRRIKISAEILELFTAIMTILKDNTHLLNGTVSDKNRKKLVENLGQAGSDYRMKIYRDGFNNSKKEVNVSDVVLFLEFGLKYIDHSIEANRREDDLFHSYNLINLDDSSSIKIRHLYEMLEGQVAALNSTYLSLQDSVHLLNSLRKSKLYREDQKSYILYPDRQLALFSEKNIIPKEQFEKSTLLQTLIQQNDKSIINRDIKGDVHFNGKLRNAQMLKSALNNLNSDFQPATEKERQLILNIFESVFDHQSFTGRSGTFYKYEGLGSIYWHMVSKLLLAVQDTYYRAIELHADTTILETIKTYYYEIREGIGVHKNPKLYGAFPTDPYSHTPGNSGVQQPGMTGQVKEDIISRFGELGVIVRNGNIRFDPSILDRSEFLKKSQEFHYYNVRGLLQTLLLSQGMLSFTLCQVPVIYIDEDKRKIVITKNDDTEEEIDGLVLDAVLSRSIFRHENLLKKIQVFV